MSEITNTATIRVVADASGVEAGLRPAVDAAQRAGQAVAQVGAGATASARNVESAQRSIIGSIQRTTAAMESGGRQSAAYYEVMARQRGVDPAALRPYLDQLRAVEQAQARTAVSAGASAGQIAAAMRQVPAQVTDIVTSLQGGQAPLTVFLQQGGQLRDSFGSAGTAARALGGYVLGLINPYTVAAAAAGVLALAYKSGADESARFERSIILSGNAAGVTSGRLTDMARTVAAISGSRDAADAVAALVETAQVPADSLQKFAIVAIGAQQILGRAVEDTVGEFEKLGKSPLQALNAIDEKYHFIDASTLRVVKALQDQGEMTRAADVAQQAYANGVQEQKDKVLATLNSWEKAWLGLKMYASDAANAAINFAGGREKSSSDKIDDLLDERKALEANLDRAKKRNLAADVASYQAELDANERSINALRNKTAAQNDQAKAAAAAQKVDDAQKEWDKQSDKFLNREAQQRRDIAAAIQLGKEAHLDSAVVEKRVADIRKSYSDLYNAGIDSNIAALKRRDQVEDVLAQRRIARIATQRNIGDISEEQSINDTAKEELAKIDREIRSKQAELDQVKKKFNSGKDQADKEGEIQALRGQRSNREEKQTNDLIELQDRRRQSSEALYKTGIVGATAELNSIIAQTEAQFEANQAIGLSTKQVAELQAARMYNVAARKEETAADLEAVEPGNKLAKIYRDQAQQMRDLADAKVRGAAKQELYDKPLQDLNAMVDILGALDEAAQSAAQGMASAFGSVGSAIGGMTTALTGYERTQAAIAAQLAGSIKDAHGDPAKIQRANQMAAEASAQAQIKSYGDMASAAKGFFDKNSKGYQVLQGVEKAYRAAEMVMAIESMTKKIFFKETEVAANAALNAAKLSGEATASAASTGLAATEASAWGVTAVVKAIASMPFPLNLAAGAATLAAVVGIGAKIMGSVGGAGVGMSEDRQKKQGTGSVLGDGDAKSESIKNALDAVEKNTYQGLSINYNMLASLRSIDTNIGSFASQLVRSTDVTGKYAATTNSFGGGFLGNVMSSIFGGKTSVADTGFTLSPTSLADALAKGVSGMQYADMHKSGGWFSSGKDWTDSKSLGAAANTQFAAVIKSLAGSVKTAGELLGLSGDDFANKLNSFVIDIGKVSLKDLKGDDLQKAVESIFSKLGDDLAQFAVGGLQDLQQVGEGYLETLARIGSEYQTIDIVFQSFGKTFGEVGVASAGARDRLVQLAGGLDKFTSQGEYFLTNFFSEQEQAAALKSRIDPTLAQYGLSSSGENAIKVFQDFVVCLDTTTEAGAKAYTELMSIAPAFKTVVDAQRGATRDLLDIQAQTYKLLNDKVGEATVLERQHALALADLSPAMRAATQKLWDLQAAADAIDKVKSDGSALLNNVDNAYSVLQGIVGREKDLLQKRIDKETEAVNRLKGLTDSIASTLDSFKVPGTELSRRQAAQAEIRANLAITKAGGSLSDDQVASLKKALSVVTEDVSSQFRSYQDYLRDLYQTKNDIAALGSVTGDQLDTQQAQLDLDKKQVEQYDLMLTKAQEQVNVLKGISTTGLNIEQALKGVGTAILAAKGNSSVAGVSAIAATYQSALGRAPDAAGLDYWQNIAAGGTPLSTITDAISNSAEAQVQKLYHDLLGRTADAAGLDYWLKSGASMETIKSRFVDSDEYKKLHPFAVGTNFVPETMPALVHQGERIIPAADNRALMSVRARAGSGGNEALVAEIRALRTEVAELKSAASRTADATEKTAGSTGQLAEQVDNVTDGGNAMRADVFGIVRTKEVA
jgi:phage-related minor tail protein